MGKKKDGQASGGSGGWLTTYTDLMTLLLTFFVLLLSMSVIVEERRQEALNSVLGAFGILAGGRSTIQEEGTDADEFKPPMQRSEDFNIQMLHSISMHKELEPEIEILKEEDKIVIRIGQRVMFLPGSSVLRGEVRDYLSRLAGFLREQTAKIEIRGHTGRFEAPEDSNWPLDSWVVSVERAQAVYQYFYRHGIQVERMSAHGFSYNDPVVDDMAYPHLRNKNRRVEIVLGGDAAAVPVRLTKERPKPAEHFRYKDFFFRLAPGDREENKAAAN